MDHQERSVVKCIYTLTQKVLEAKGLCKVTPVCRLSFSFLGDLEFKTFQLSPWIVAYHTILWTFVVSTNALSFGYIIKKLSTSNLINLIAILDCLNNILGFAIIGIFSLLASFESSYRYLACKANFTILILLILTCKSSITYKESTCLELILYLSFQLTQLLALCQLQDTYVFDLDLIRFGLSFSKEQCSTV